MDFQLVLKILQRKAWIIGTIPLMAVVCAFFFVSKMDKVYKSNAQLSTGFTTDDVVQMLDENSSSWEINTKFINLNESMNSLPVMSLISYRLMIHDLENSKPFRVLEKEVVEENNFTKKSLDDARELLKQRLTQIKTLNPSEPTDRHLAQLLAAYEYDYESLKENFKIKRVTSSDYIAVEFVSENPYLSAFAVNAVCEEFIRYNRTLKNDRSSESLDFFENLVNDKKRVLDLKTTALNDFKVDNNIVNYGAETENKISQISQYELNREIEEKKINGLQLELNTIEAKKKNGGQQTSDEAVLINQRIVKLRNQINESNSSTDAGQKEKARKLRDELQLEISRLNQLAGVDPPETLEKEYEKLKLELDIARSNLASINASLRNLKYNVSGFATKEAKIADLDRDVDVASEEYLSAQEKYNTAKNKSLVVGSSIRQILIGQPNLEPEPSKGIIILGLTGFSSFALCLIAVLLTEYIDFTIRMPHKLEKSTGLKTIGVVNNINIKEFDIQKTFSEKGSDKEANALVQFLRKIRYEIQKSQGKVILVSSTQASVGKSFIIVCLSYTLSLINKRVLIIDTNFRRNSLTKLLLAQVETRKMLNSGTKNPLLLLKNNGKAIEEEEEDDDSYKNIISKTKFSGVDLIGNIGGSGSPSEILAGRDFKEMISQLEDQYDYIFLEGPSLNEYADSKELVDYVDKVIAVFGANTHLNSIDKESLSFLKSIKGKLIGSILNKVQLKDLTA